MNLCVTPKSPKGWHKMRIFTYFCVAFYVFVAGNRIHFKFDKQIDLSKSPPTQNVPEKGVVNGHVT